MVRGNAEERVEHITSAKRRFHYDSCLRKPSLGYWSYCQFVLEQRDLLAQRAREIGA